MYSRLDQHREEMHEIYDNGVGRGYFHSLKVYREGYSIVLGTTLYVYAAPHSGKTQWVFDLIVDMAIQHGFKTILMSPEAGKEKHIYRKLVEMVAEKDYISTFNNQMTKAERLAAETFVYEHFVILDFEDAETKKGVALRDWYERIDKVEKELGMEFQITLVDPIDELNIDWRSEPSRDIVLQKELIWIRKNAEMKTRYNIVVVHLRDQKKIAIKVDGQTQLYYPAPDPQELAHGQEWYRRGMAMIGLWRPPTYLEIDIGLYYAPNDTVVLYGKQKPEEVKEQGSYTKRVIIKWDAKRHRYYHKKLGIDMYPKSINVETNTSRETLNLP
ncbi:MAG: hypothetical protein ACI9DM_002197 [Cyclobacteriaceae bacterium]|jgi:hypothetical protein